MASLAPQKFNFADRLIQAIQKKQSRVVVGLDPRLQYMPEHLCKKKISKYGKTVRAIAETFLEFNKQIIDGVVRHAVAVKPQVAFYEQYGDIGIWALLETIKYAKERELLVIVDTKRNDIGTTAQAYAEAYLGKVDFWDGVKIPVFDVDAITINPFLGYDGAEPFIQKARDEGKGLFVLIRTSNPSSADIQGIYTEEGYVFERVASMVQDWGVNTEGTYGYRSIGAVVGATYPVEAMKIRSLMPKSFFLVPGYGAQGATVADVKPCFNPDGFGAVINASRSVIYAYRLEPEISKYKSKEFAMAAENAARRMKEEIEGILQ